MIMYQACTTGVAMRLPLLVFVLCLAASHALGLPDQHLDNLQKCSSPQQWRRPAVPDLASCNSHTAESVRAASALLRRDGQPKSSKWPSVVVHSWEQLEQLLATRASSKGSSSSRGRQRIVLKGQHVVTASSTLDIASRSVHIVAPQTQLRCPDEGPAFKIRGNSKVILEGITIHGCEAAPAIDIRGSHSSSAADGPQPLLAADDADLVLVRAVLHSNAADKGAGIHAVGARVMLHGCSLYGNSAANCGAAVYLNSSSFVALNSSFRDSSAEWADMEPTCSGGAVNAVGSWVALVDSSFTGNQAARGSAVALHDPMGLSYISSSTFNSNRGPSEADSKEDYSGAVLVSSTNQEGSEVAASDSSAKQALTAACASSAAPGADGDAADTSGLVIVDSRFQDNSAAHTLMSSGGGLHVEWSWAAVINTTFSGHSGQAAAAAGAGAASRNLKQQQEQPANSMHSSSGTSPAAGQGGCFSALNAAVLLSNSSFTNCHAIRKGGALHFDQATAVIVNVSISNSSAGQYGGGCLYGDGSHVIGVGVTSSSCKGSNGGGWLLENGKLLLLGSIIQNCSGLWGGGMQLYAMPHAVLQQSSLVHNEATQGAALEVSESNVNLTDCTLSYNRAYQRGGALVSSPTSGDAANISFAGCRLVGNRAESEHGGAIAATLCKVQLIETYMARNRARQFGGAVYGDGAQLELQHVHLAHNDAMFGAAVFSESARTSLTINCSNMSSNGGHQVVDGGAVYFKDGAATIQRSSIKHNCAANTGGGIHAVNSTIDLRSTLLVNNTAMFGMGGAVFVHLSKLQINSSSLLHNLAMRAGAAVLSSDSALMLSSSLFQSNQALVGGSLATMNGGSVTTTGGCMWANNHALAGGAMMLHDLPSMLVGDQFLNNTASLRPAHGSETVNYITAKPVGSGGAVYQYRGRLSIVNSSLIDNHAISRTGQGGGLYTEDGVSELLGSQLIDNWASFAGGAIRVSSSGSSCATAFSMSHALLRDNHAQLGGAVAVGAVDGSGEQAGMSHREGSSSSQPSTADCLASGAPPLRTQQQVSPLSGPLVSISASVFGANKAMVGGAVCCSNCADLNVTGSNFTANMASSTGGAISSIGVWHTLLQGCLFDGDVAASGGAVSLLHGLSFGAAAQQPDAALYAAANSNSSSLLESAAAGSNSTAASAVISSGPSTATVSNCSFVSNAADPLLASAAHRDYKQRGEAALRRAGLKHLALQPTANSFVMAASNSELPSCSVPGTGGALCISPSAGGIVLLSTMVKFVNNSAILGGAVFVESCGQSATALQANSSSSETAPCQIQVSQVTTSTFANNHAGAGPSGGANMYLSDLDLWSNHTATMPTAAVFGAGSSAVLLAAARYPAVAAGPVGVVLSNTSGMCSSSSTNGKQPSTGSSGSRSRVKTLCSGLPLQANPSTGQLPPLLLAVVDQLGKPVAPWVSQKLAVEAECEDRTPSNSCHLIGVTKLTPDPDSSVTFDAMKLLGQPGEKYTVKFILRLPSQQTISGSANSSMGPVAVRLGGSSSTDSVLVAMPMCKPGQAITPWGCFNCSNPRYSIGLPTNQCSICPSRKKTAECSGQVLLPADGYWHSGPDSNVLLPCNTYGACERDPTQIAQLKQLQLQFGTATAEAAPAITQRYTAKLCAHGYTGNLCGQCDLLGQSQAYGRSFTGQCRPCLTLLAAAFAYAFARIFEVLIVAALVAVTLMGISTRKQHRGRLLSRQQRAYSKQSHRRRQQSSMWLHPVASGDGKQQQLQVQLQQQQQLQQLPQQQLQPQQQQQQQQQLQLQLPQQQQLLQQQLQQQQPQQELQQRQPQQQLQQQQQQLQLQLPQQQQLLQQQVQQPQEQLPSLPTVTEGTDTSDWAADLDTPFGRQLTAAAAAGGAAINLLPEGCDVLPPISSSMSRAGTALQRPRSAGPGHVRADSSLITPGLSSHQLMSNPSIATLPSMASPLPSGSLSGLYGSSSAADWNCSTVQLGRIGSRIGSGLIPHNSATAPAAAAAAAGSAAAASAAAVCLVTAASAAAADGTAAAAEQPGSSSAGTSGSPADVIEVEWEPLQHAASAPVQLECSLAIRPVFSINESVVSLEGEALQRHRSSIILSNSSPEEDGAAFVSFLPRGLGPTSLGKQPDSADSDAATAAAVAQLQQPARHRTPMFAREFKGMGKLRHVWHPSSALTLAVLFEVVKDYVQVLSILHIPLIHLQWHPSLSYAAGVITFTPLSSLAWVSLDCLMPRSGPVLQLLGAYRVLVTAGMMGVHVLLVLLVWVTYAIATKKQHWLRQLRQWQPRIIVSMLVVVSYFYPSTASAVLSTFACQPLPKADVQANEWFWSPDLNRECLQDGVHRAMALGLGVPGTIAIVAYPCLQAYLLSRQFKAGGLRPTSMFFVNYGHLVENFRPRLYFWGSIVELRKLALVAVVLALQSVSSMAQLLGCWVVLMVYQWSMQALMPYPFKLLNKLYMSTNVVLIVFVWVNVLLAAMGPSLGDMASLALQGLALLIAGVMLMVLLGCCFRRMRQVLKYVWGPKVKHALVKGQAALNRQVSSTFSMRRVASV